MEIKCPGCNGPLTYNIKLGKMVCDYCGNQIDVESLKTDDAKSKNFNINIYKCKSCGTDLYYGLKTEVTSVCAYCGNHSVTFNRTANIQKPDSIIPFKITKEEAFKIFRKKVSKFLFIPNDFEKVKIDSIVPVYVPYRIYDIYILN